MAVSRTHLSRRGLLAGGAGSLALAALAGCSGGTLSSDPRQLVLWYWNRSLNPRLLKKAGSGIPGMPSRSVRADLTGAASWDTKLRTTLAGRAYVPDLVMINSNVSIYFPDEQLFIDLNRYTTAAERARYYDWKWSLGTTPSGRHPFWPVDTGPTGFFYRQDVFQKAGLPTDPREVQSAIATWDGLIALGRQLRKNADAATLIQGLTVYNQFVNASKERYFDRDDTPLFLKSDSTIRQAWDTAVRAITSGITANLGTGTDQNAGWVSGRVAAHIEGAWWSQVLGDTAPKTAGKWRVTQQPVRPGNSGGSFLAAPTTCKDPRAAYEFMTWITSPENQAATFNDIQLFPSTPGSFSSGIMRNPGSFFGSQNPLDVFGAIAGNVPSSYISPLEAQTGAFGTEIANVESTGKDPDRAWRDAVEQTRRVLSKKGVEL